RRIEKARPARAGLELGVRIEQRQITADAVEYAVAVIVPERAGERALGAALTGDAVLFLVELRAPLGIGFDDLVHQALRVSGCNLIKVGGRHSSPTRRRRRSATLPRPSSGTSMLHLLVALAAASALAAIAADWRETKPRVFFVLKPLTTLLIAGIASLAPESDYRNLILVGLALSLIGDICLMFQGETAFVGGLSSFLLAHLVFMAAFLIGLPAWPLPWWVFGFAVYGVAFAMLLLPRA